MNVEEAWDAFVKSESVKKASIDEKLDVLAAQMNEVQTTVDRLAETIPEEQGDAGAMELANDSASMMPNPEDALGAVAGAPQEEGVAADAGAEEMPEEGMGEDEDMGLGVDEIDEQDIGGGTPEGGEESAPAEGMDAALPEESMDVPPTGESNDVIAMVKEMIASEEDPGKLAQLSKILAAAVGTQTAQSTQSFEPEGESEMQMMKSDSVAKAEEGTGVEGEKSTVDTDGKGTGGDSALNAKPGAEATEAATDAKLQDAPAPLAKADGPSPELMEKIMDAVKGVLVEYYGEGSEEDIGESAEEAAQDGEEVKVDDEDAEVHVDVEDGGNVTVEDEDDDDGNEEISDADKIERNDELSDESSPFADSDCINKSFADMLHGKIAQTVGVDGQFAKNKYATNRSHYRGEAGEPGSQRSEAWKQWNAHLEAKGNGPKGKVAPRDLKTIKQVAEGEGEPVVGNTGMTPSNSTESMDASACKSGDTETIAEMSQEEKEDQRTPAQEKYRSMNPELYDHVAGANSPKKSASDNGKPIMSLKDMMAIRKSDRMEVASTSNGSLTPPSLEGAAPIRMSSFRDMMGDSNSIRKSIEADADAYRLYKSQQNM